MTDLVGLFRSLQKQKLTTASTARFVAEAIPAYDNHKLAKDANGAPALLISVTDVSGVALGAELEHLTVEHDMLCRVSNVGETRETEELFTIIQCTNATEDLHTYFLQMASALLGVLGTSPTRETIAQAVGGLTELFRAMRRPPKKTLQGLWAEMLLIISSQTPDVLVEAWHSTPHDRYDFSSGTERVEVKSSGIRSRRHHFSLEQLTPPAGTTAIIASVFVEAAGHGTSLGDMLNQGRNLLSGRPDLVLHLQQTAADMLGYSWERALKERFDLEAAKQSITFYDSIVVPSVDKVIPPEVGQVHFVSDLTSAPAADLAVYRSGGGLLAALETVIPQ